MLVFGPQNKDDNTEKIKRTLLKQRWWHHFSHTTLQLLKQFPLLSLTMPSPISYCFCVDIRLLPSLWVKDIVTLLGWLAVHICCTLSRVTINQAAIYNNFSKQKTQTFTMVSAVIKSSKRFAKVVAFYYIKSP